MVEAEIIEDEAIDCCPVNCISKISWEDLVLAEIRRKDQVVNPYANLFSENAGNVSNQAMMSNKWQRETALETKREWEENNIVKTKRNATQTAQARAMKKLYGE